MTIRTHIAVRPQTSAESQSPNFTLNALQPLSTNVEVRRYPLRVIAWGLTGTETVSVQMARVSSLGNTHWALSDDACCPCILPPDEIVNAEHMPYIKCGRPLVLTADNPTAHIDDAGIYYFEYEGTGTVVIDHYDDPVIRKADWCGCE